LNPVAVWFRHGGLPKFNTKRRSNNSFDMKVFFTVLAAAGRIILADDVYFSPATGAFTCSGNGGDALLLNDQAVSAQNCRIMIAGFSQNLMDSTGSVLFASYRPNATLSLDCRDDADTAIRGDTFCICEPINSSGEGCAEGTWNSGNYGGSAPSIAQKWPSVEPGKTIYATATGTFTCSAVAGNVCTMNPQASRTVIFSLTASPMSATLTGESDLSARFPTPMFQYHAQ